MRLFSRPIFPPWGSSPALDEDRVGETEISVSYLLWLTQSRAWTQVRQGRHQPCTCPTLRWRASLNLYPRHLPCLTLIPTLLSLLSSEATASALCWSPFMRCTWLSTGRVWLSLGPCLSWGPLEEQLFIWIPIFQLYPLAGCPVTWATLWLLPPTPSFCMWSLRNHCILCVPTKGYKEPNGA